MFRETGSRSVPITVQSTSNVAWLAPLW